MVTVAFDVVASVWPAQRRRPEWTRSRRLPARDLRLYRSCIGAQAAATGGLLLSMRIGTRRVGDRIGERGAGLVGDAERMACATDAPLSMRAGGRGAPSTRRWRDQPRCVVRRSRRCHVRAAARCRRPQSLARDAAAVRRRSRAARQGIGYPPAPIEESIAVEGWRCSSVGSAPEVAISIAPALSLERGRATGRQVGGFAVMPTIVGARGTAVDTSRADA